MKLLTILGARPQFIKAAAVSRAIMAREDIDEVIVHTGQHFDFNMSEIFFQQLDIPRPHYNLNISGISHGAMTGRMLEGIEGLIEKEDPDWVLVYGDTNSTLAGALAAAKLHVPLIHVEAGLRSNNPSMPEEINRILTDRVSTLLLCPTQAAVDNLQKEGFPFLAASSKLAYNQQRIVKIGDVMLDAVLYYRERAEQALCLSEYGLSHQHYVLCTVHRQENTNNASRLEEIFKALRIIAKETAIIMPLHPRTKQKIEQELSANLFDDIIVTDPLPYLEIQRLEMSAQVIITDSGGIQKEAYFHQVPCITLRDETEWTETILDGWNQLVGADYNKIITAYRQAGRSKVSDLSKYGNGKAADEILKALF